VFIFNAEPEARGEDVQRRVAAEPAAAVLQPVRLHQLPRAEALQRVRPRFELRGQG